MLIMSYEEIPLASREATFQLMDCAKTLAWPLRTHNIRMNVQGKQSAQEEKLLRIAKLSSSGLGSDIGSVVLQILSQARS